MNKLNILGYIIYGIFIRSFIHTDDVYQLTAYICTEGVKGWFLLYCPSILLAIEAFCYRHAIC